MSARLGDDDLELFRSNVSPYGDGDLAFLVLTEIDRLRARERELEERLSEANATLVAWTENAGATRMLLVKLKETLRTVAKWCENRGYDSMADEIRSELEGL